MGAACSWLPDYIEDSVACYVDRRSVTTTGCDASDVANIADANEVLLYEMWREMEYLEHRFVQHQLYGQTT